MSDTTTWYFVDYAGRIKPVEVYKETGKFVLVKRWESAREPSRVAKDSRSERYCRTEADAIAFERGRREARLEGARRMLAIAEREMEKFNSQYPA